MYSYTVEILGLGCELVACELDTHEMSLIKEYMKTNNLLLEEVFSSTEHIKHIDLGVNSWYELDDICHIYGAYPNHCSVKIKGVWIIVFAYLTLRRLKPLLMIFIH